MWQEHPGPSGSPNRLKGAMLIDYIYYRGDSGFTAWKGLSEKSSLTPNSDIFNDTIKPQESFINVIIVF